MSAVVLDGRSMRRAAIAAATLVLATYLAFAGRATTNGLTAAAVAIGAVVFVPPILRDVGFGVALIPAVAAAVPFAIGTGTSSAVAGALVFALVLVGIWFIRAMVRRDLRIARSPINAPALALGLVWVLALVNSDVERSPLVAVPDRWTFIQLGGLSVTLASVAALWLALNAGRELRWIQVATWSFLAIGAVYGLGYFLGVESAVAFVAANGMFTMWVVALSYGQALFNQALPRWLRGALLILAAAWLYKALILQNWFFSAWAGALVAILVVSFARSLRWGSVVLVAAAVVVWLNYDAVYEAVYGGAEQKGDFTRLNIWQNASDLAARYPILGTGPAGYAPYFQSMYADTGFAMSTHSNYWDLLLQTGLVGCVVFAWLIATLLFVGWRACRRWRTGFAGGYAAAAVGGLVALLLTMGMGDWFIPFVYNQTIEGFRHTVLSWVFLGLMGGLAIRADHQPSSTPS